MDALGKAHAPWGTEGTGCYTAATLGCFRVIEEAQPMVLKALSQVPASRYRNCLRLADFGTADGGTSLPLLGNVIDVIKRNHPSTEVEVSYEDQPNSDFKSLFYHTQGLKAIQGVEPYLKRHKGVFVTASGTSFFEQCFPSNSIHLAMSFTAMHWLRKKPCNISTGLHMTQAQGAELAAFAKQAEEDWQHNLLQRAAELAPGGCLVIVNFCVSPEGHWLGHSDVGPCMYDTMKRLWKQMQNEGRITQAEFEDTTFINYYRTEEEFVRPFSPGAPVHKAGLRLVEHKFDLVRCPFRDAYRAKKGDPVQHAKWYVPTLRTWSNSTFTSALSDSRPAEEKEALVDELFSRYEAEVAKDPEGHGMDYAHCYMHIQKVEEGSQA